MSESNREDARLRRAFASLAGEERPAGGCPESDRIWQAARAQLSPREAGRIVDHVAGCPSCAESWRLAMAPVDAEQAGPASGTAIRPWVRWAAGGGLAAAALALVAVLAVFQDGGEPRQAPTLRSSEGLSITSSVPEDELLPRDGCLLRWTPGPEGALYDVRVGTRELRTLVREQELERPEFTVPEESLSGLPPGAKIYWRVEALLPDGRRIPSETFVARIE